MKTFVLNLLAYVCAFSAYAQDIKVKKGQIMIDNNVVASIKEEKNGYLFSNPDGSPVITVYITSYTKGKVQTHDQWLIFTSPDGKTFELPNPKDRLLISFNNCKIDCVVAGSNALVASSHNNTCGSLASARAIATRCF